MRTDKAGNPLWKSVYVRVILPEGHKELKWHYRAKPGMGCTEDNMEKLLGDVVEHLEKRFVYWEFKMVQIAANRFNFVYAGLKAAQIAA